MGIISLFGPLGVLAGALGIIQSITAALLYIPFGILNWVIDTPVSLTNSFVVQRGWEVCRDLVNIFLVVVLIAIALATILRIQAYSYQKNLLKLIVAAILVNFTPVICGIFIDIANVIMHIFKNSALSVTQLFARNNPFVNMFTPDGFANTINSLITNKSFAMELVGRLIASITFNVLTFFILFAYALIFLIRIMVIWALVITSPFALLGYAFPKLPLVGGVLKQWVKQFMQWTFIGIPLFFFLYLAGIVMSNPVCKGTLPTVANMANWTSASSMCSILSLLFPIFFLIIGLGMAFKTGTDADKILDWGQGKVKGWGKSTGKAAVSQTFGRFAQTEAGKKIMRGAYTFGMPIDQNSGETKDWKSSSGRERAGRILSAPLRIGLRTAASAGIKYGSQENKGIEEKMKKYAQAFPKDDETLALEYGKLSPWDYEGKIAITRQLANMKGQVSLNKLSSRQREEGIKLMAQYDKKNIEDVVKFYPGLITGNNLIQNALAGDIAKDEDAAKIEKSYGLNHANVADQDSIREKTAYKKIVSALDKENIPGISSEMINSDAFMDMVILFRSPNFIRNIADEKGSEFIDRFNERLGVIGPDQVAKTNFLLASSCRNPGYSAGFFNGANRHIFENYGQASGRY